MPPSRAPKTRRRQGIQRLRRQAEQRGSEQRATAYETSQGTTRVRMAGLTSRSSAAVSMPPALPATDSASTAGQMNTPPSIGFPERKPGFFSEKEPG